MLGLILLVSVFFMLPHAGLIAQHAVHSAQEALAPTHEFQPSGFGDPAHIALNHVAAACTSNGAIATQKRGQDDGFTCTVAKTPVEYSARDVPGGARVLVHVQTTEQALGVTGPLPSALESLCTQAGADGFDKGPGMFVCALDSTTQLHYKVEPVAGTDEYTIDGSVVVPYKTLAAMPVLTPTTSTVADEVAHWAGAKDTPAPTPVTADTLSNALGILPAQAQQAAPKQ